MSKRRGNGEGSIYYNKSLKKWVGQYSINGKKKALYGNTRAEVAEKLHKTLLSIKGNTHIDKSKVTINDIQDILLNDKTQNSKIKESTQVRNKQTAKIISKMFIADLPIQEVSEDDINDALFELTPYYANSSISKVCMKLAKIFNYAARKKIIVQDPFSIKDNITKPKSNKPDKEIEALTIEQEKAFREQLNKKDYKYKDIFIVLFETGMRIGEVLALRKRRYRFQTQHHSR